MSVCSLQPPLAMVLYGLAVVPMAESLREAQPDVLQPWYADDAAMVGPASGLAATMRLLMQHGPDRGYFPEPAKSVVISRPDARPVLEAALNEFNFSFRDGARYLGGHIGDAASRLSWLHSKVAAWVDGVHALASVACSHPQSAYALTAHFRCS